MNIHLEVTEAPWPTDLKFLGDQLTAFNDSDVGPSQRVALAVFVRDETDRIVGGISGYTAWGWLYIQWLWVDENFRGQHMAGTMLDAAEREAAARGCHSAYIDTFNPGAAKTYQKQGYQTFGILPNFPLGRDRIFLQKKLSVN